MKKYTRRVKIHVTFDRVAARPMGRGSDDSDKTRTNQSRQPLCKHRAWRRQPDDLAAPRLTVTFNSQPEKMAPSNQIRNRKEF